jgi:hypothetical protein
MASDRFGSVSASHRTKAAEKWFKNATSDAKHKTVDKELQRIKNLGVVSVRKRHEDVSSPSPTSSRRESFISNEPDHPKKNTSSDMGQTPAMVEDGYHVLDIPILPSATAAPPPESKVQKMIELESEDSENIELPKIDSSPFMPIMDETPTLQLVDTIVTETNEMDEDELNLASNDDQSITEIGLEKDPASVQSAVSATQDLQRFIVDDTDLPDDASINVAVPFASGELSKSRPSSEGKLDSTSMVLQPSKRSSNKSTGSSAYSQAESDSSLTVKNLINSHAHSSPASSFQSTTSASLPVSCGSPGTVISEMYILVDQAKKASPEQGELAEIHEKLLGLVNALNVWHAANPADSTPQGDSNEVEELRKQVKDLEHKCELQQVDLHERAAYHNKLMQDKDALLRKLSSTQTEGGDYTPSDGSPTDPSPMSTAVKLMNRLSTGSNVSSASFMTNPRSGSRAGSRRLNPRPETPLPPQLPPPRDPLPPIPQAEEPTPQHSVHKDYHEKVVKELLHTLQDQQSKSKSTIDTLEARLSRMTKHTLELEQSIGRLESELQAKQRPPPQSPPPAAAATMPNYSPKKKQSRRSFNLLTLFSKR